jgi:hypothetical protein
VLNFILNAVEATSGVDQYRRSVVVSTAKDSNDAIVAVRDSGVGLDADSADHLFQPFYWVGVPLVAHRLSACPSCVHSIPHSGDRLKSYKRLRFATSASPDKSVPAMMMCMR